MDAARTGVVPDPSAPVPDRDLLHVLQRAGPMTAEALGTAVAMSRTAVMRRLASLGAAGLVDRRAVHRGVGRPRYLYDVSPDAQGHLDSRYGALAGSLFDAVVDVGGHELLARVFDSRRRRSTAVIRRRFIERGVADASLAVRAGELAAWNDEHGYTADVSDIRGIRLLVHNCPILRIATASPAACDAELRLIADVLEADVARESLIATGARRCIYRIEPRGAGFAGPFWQALQMRVPATGPTPPSEEPPPAWRREQMRPTAPRRGEQRATRWPPAEEPSTVVRRDSRG